ncbi:hypothetical protein OnM2_051070, partial [Erysiphe neolycopersici]
MFTKHTLFLLAVALAEARFGQEQGNGAVQAIGALGDIGQPGQAATLAGGSIQHLLAAANPCKSNIVETLGNDDRVIAAARGYVAAEQNFNPFNVKIPSVCAETDLPKTEALRGVVPLIDPDVTGQDVENANAKSSIQKPFDATGKSVAEVMAANGFTNFTGVKLDGTKVDLTGVKAKEASAVGGEKENEQKAAGGGAGGAGGGNKDNKSAAGDKKEEEEKASGAGQEKENEEKSKAAGEDKNQKKIKACSALLSSIDKGKSAGADKKAAGSSEKMAEAEKDEKEGGKKMEKKAEAEKDEKDEDEEEGGKKNEKKAEAEKDEKEG